MKNKPVMDVAVAIIKASDGRILISKRPKHVYYGGVWEFPGGKVEVGETVNDALEREIKEELGIDIQDSKPLIYVEHDYGDRYVKLHVKEVLSFRGEPTGLEGQEVKWIQLNELSGYRFPEANEYIRKVLVLPQYYLITPEPKDHSSFIQSFEASLSPEIKLVQLRAKTLSLKDYKSIAQEVIKICQERGVRCLLNKHQDLVGPLGADGFHLTGRQLHNFQYRPLSKDFIVSASCHNLSELKRAEQLDLDFAVLSPVQRTQSHPEREPLGWDTFRSWVKKVNIPVIALGGLTQSDLPHAREMGAQGIAAIQALWTE